MNDRMSGFDRVIFFSFAGSVPDQIVLAVTWWVPEGGEFFDLSNEVAMKV